MIYRISAVLIAVIILAFLLSGVIFILGDVDFTNVIYILNNTLIPSLITTLFLIVFVSILSFIIAIFMAYTTTFYEFKGRKIISILAILPLAIPVYIGAYIYGAISPSFFSISGLIIIYTLFLYPYLYLSLKVHFQNNMQNYLEVSQTLTKNKLKYFKKIIIGSSKVSIAIGTTLIIFELVSDFAAANYFGIRTFSTEIYRIWFQLNDFAAAFILAIVALIVLLIVIYIEQKVREREKYYQLYPKKLKRQNIKLKLKVIIYFISTIIISLGLIIPLTILIKNTILSMESIQINQIIEATVTSLLIGTITTIAILALALLANNYLRFINKKKQEKYRKIYFIGYALPAIMVGFLVYIVGINFLPVITNTIFIVVIAYFIRFFSVGYSQILIGQEKNSNAYSESSYLLGKNKHETFFKIDLPLLKPYIITATMLIFIEVIKEITILLYVRPYNLNTLSSRVYRYANDEMLIESSSYSLIIVIITTIIILILLKRGKYD